MSNRLTRLGVYHVIFIIESLHTPDGYIFVYIWRDLSTPDTIFFIHKNVCLRCLYKSQPRPATVFEFLQNEEENSKNEEKKTRNL